MPDSQRWTIDPVVVDRLVNGRPVGRRATNAETITAYHYLRTVRGFDVDQATQHLTPKQPLRIPAMLERATRVGFQPTIDYWTAAYSKAA